MENKEHIDKQEQITPDKVGMSPKFLVVMVVALVFGIFFRLYSIGYKIYSHDEVYTSLRAAGNLGGRVFNGIKESEELTTGDIRKFLQPDTDKNILDTLSITANFQPHQVPLYFLITHYWMRLWGHTPAVMRSLALVFSLMCIPGVYWLSWELFRSRRTALFAMTLLALSPYHILFAQDARPYSLWALLTILSSAALLRAMREDQIQNWGIYTLTLVIGMYSHQLFALVAVVHGIYFVIVNKTHWRNYRGFVSAAILGLIFYAPWFYQLIHNWERAASRMGWVNFQLPWYRYIQKWMLIITSPIIDLDFGSENANLIPYILRAFVLLFLAWAVLYLIRTTSRRVWSFVLLMCLIPSGALIVPDIILGGIRSIGGRYFVPVNIATILSVAYFLSTKLDEARKASQKKWQLASALLLILGLFSGINISRAETWWNKELSRIKPEFVRILNASDEALLIVSGDQPTNLGDLLSLSLKADPDTEIKLYPDPTDIEFPNSQKTIFWFPSTVYEVLRISEAKHLRVSELIPDTLWRVDGRFGE